MNGRSPELVKAERWVRRAGYVSLGGSLGLFAFEISQNTVNALPLEMYIAGWGIQNVANLLDTRVSSMQKASAAVGIAMSAALSVGSIALHNDVLGVLATLPVFTTAITSRYKNRR